jgi:hypothetical protein
MPAVPPSILLDSLAKLDVAINSTLPGLGTNSASHSLQVVCAWPVSGQYGPGSRILCVFVDFLFPLPSLTHSGFVGD